MSRIFFVSDTHFGHQKEFLYSPRGFVSSEQHDQSIIERWNSIVNEDDIVYHLGDLVLGDNNHGIECVKQLNGYIKIIRGNHDTDKRIELYKTLENVEYLGWAEVIKYKKYNFYLSHHPTMTANYDNEKPPKAHLINLFGHTHQKTKFYDDNIFMYHVGLDSNSCYPVLLDDIIEEINNEFYSKEEKECTQLGTWTTIVQQVKKLFSKT